MTSRLKSDGHPPPSTWAASGHTRSERVLHAMARALTARPKTILVVWLILVAAATPFALRLPDVLSEQGASKLVPGTPPATTTADLNRAFPMHSERETVIVLSRWDRDEVSNRQLLGVLDGALAQYRAQPSIAESISAYTIYRDATVEFVRAQLDAAKLADTGPPTLTDRAILDGSIQAQQLPAAQADLLRAGLGADNATITRLAGQFVVAADWRDFPFDVPVRDVMSADGTTAIVVVRFAAGGPEPDIEHLRALTRSVINTAGKTAVQANITGELPLLQDTYDRADADIQVMEYAAYLVIMLVLLVFFRAVVPSVITVVVISLAMSVSQAWLYWLGHYVHLTQFTSTIMTFVMLGAGVDYSMLLSSRYRQERLLGHSIRDATVNATARSGESVLLAGAAVVLSFGATLLSPVDWIPPLGYGGLVGIPIILIAALTITPCLLMLLGDRFFAVGLKPLADMETTGLMARSLRRATRITAWCPLLVVLVFAAVTVPMAMIATSQSLSADPVALSPDTDAKTGSDVIVRTWGKGTLFPTVIGGRLPSGMVKDGTLTATGRSALNRLAEDLADDQGVQRVTDATHPFGTDLERPDLKLPASAIRNDYVARDGTTRIVVTLKGDPFSDDARATADRLSFELTEHKMPGLTVAGATAVDDRYNVELQRSFVQMVTIVAAGLLVLLTIALRSVLIPIRLILTIMMSNIWAIAITVMVYQVWLDKPVINDLPILLIILMMGLGMDYEIFLITRVRDLVRQGQDDVTATQNAVVDTGRVITAAGLVMAGSLGTMMLSSTLMLQQYGLGLGSAVLLDATLVRMFFVPASLLLFKRFNWWIPFVPRAQLASG